MRRTSINIEVEGGPAEEWVIQQSKSPTGNGKIYPLRVQWGKLVNAPTVTAYILSHLTKNRFVWFRAYPANRQVEQRAVTGTATNTR